VLLVLAGYFFSGRILEAVFKIPFRAKGSVLRGAAAEIHSLTFELFGQVSLGA